MSKNQNQIISVFVLKYKLYMNICGISANMFNNEIYLNFWPGFFTRFSGLNITLGCYQRVSIFLHPSKSCLRFTAFIRKN